MQKSNFPVLNSRDRVGAKPPIFKGSHSEIDSLRMKKHVDLKKIKKTSLLIYLKNFRSYSVYDTSNFIKKNPNMEDFIRILW